MNEGNKKERWKEAVETELVVVLPDLIFLQIFFKIIQSLKLNR